MELPNEFISNAVGVTMSGTPPPTTIVAARPGFPPILRARHRYNG